MSLIFVDPQRAYYAGFVALIHIVVNLTACP